MTNEEIEQAAKRCLTLGSDAEHYPTAEDIAEEMRSLVLQVLEEAAQKADGSRHGWPAKADEARQAIDEIVFDIRALKKPLERETAKV